MGFGDEDPATIIAANPVTRDHSQLRRALIPEHLRVLVDNERQRTPDIQIFEIGTLHRWLDGEPVEHPALGLLLAGREQPVTHDRPPQAVDVATAKGLLEQLTARLTWNRLLYEPVTPRDGVEHPGRTAAVVAVAPTGDSTIVGRVGELHPRLLQAYDVRADHVVFAQIDLSAFARLVPERLRVGVLEHLPGIERDIAVVVPVTTAAGQVEAVIREYGGSHLRAVSLFDRYRGAPLAEDEKSLAYRLRFESVDDALDEDAVQPAVERVVAVLSERLGARLRA